MLTGMTEGDWAAVVKLFRACRSRRGDKGRNDRKFLEALHYFTVHNITWRALPAEFGNWNSIWKRFWRLSQAGVFEALFEALATNSQTAHLVQMFDSTTVRAHVSAAGARRDGEKGGPRARPSAAPAGGAPRPLARGLLDQDPHKGRSRRLAARLPPDPGPGERQPPVRDPARPRAGYRAPRRGGRQRL